MGIPGTDLDRRRGSVHTTESVRVEATPCYLPNHSDPNAGRYIFGYLVRITNEGDEPVQLLGRHWIITDANGETHEVQGEGVIGVQPTIEPGGAHEYTSFCPLGTEWGTMEGTYLMVRADGSAFDARVARFYLVADAEKPGRAGTAMSRGERF